MDAANGPWTLGEIALAIGGEVVGDPQILIARPVSVGDEDPEGLTFATDERYLARAEATRVGAIIAGLDAVSAKPLIRAQNPRVAFYHFLALTDRPLPILPGVHPTAIIDPTAQVDPTAAIGAFAVIERHAQIGADVRIYAHAYIGENVAIGDASIIYPHAVLYQDVRLGRRCIVHAQAVIGADGFGFVWDGRQHRKIPQVGAVEIGDDVEIGAGTMVDRATAGATRIGNGVKVDNLVQIAHNNQLGSHVVIASQTGIAGSTTVGEGAVIGGQVGVADHISIAAGAVIGSQSGVTNDVKIADTLFGLPARPVMEHHRISAALTRLPALLKQVRDLERRVKELEG